MSKVYFKTPPSLNLCSYFHTFLYVLSTLMLLKSHNVRNMWGQCKENVRESEEHVRTLQRKFQERGTFEECEEHVRWVWGTFEECQEQVRWVWGTCEDSAKKTTGERNIWRVWGTCEVSVRNIWRLWGTCEASLRNMQGHCEDYQRTV